VQEQEPGGLPTPQAMSEPDLQISEIQLDAEYVADIAHDAPIPPENPIATRWEKAKVVGLGMKSAITRSSLQVTKHSNQNYFHLVDNPGLQATMEYALSSLRSNFKWTIFGKFTFRRTSVRHEHVLLWVCDSLEVEGCGL
jgi:hypothetical protein